MRTGIAILGLAVMAACGDSTAPGGPYVPDAIRTDTLFGQGWWRSVWSNVQECSGLAGALQFEQMTFFNVPRENFKYGTLPDTGTAVGLFIGARREIYVAELDQWATSARVVRTAKHEAMHALLYPTPSADHPREWFVDSGCGNLLSGGAYSGL